MRAAVERELEQEREAEIDRAIVEGCTRVPPGELDDWARASANRSVSAEPW